VTLRVVVAGGGTAGHIEPALNMADALRAKVKDSMVVALGTSRGLETRLVPARGYRLWEIPAVPLPRTVNADLFKVPVRLRKATDKAAEAIAGTDVVVGFGGYVALPAYLAARRLSIPYVIHEANAKPGVANRLGSRGAAAVTVNVPNAMPGAVRVGMPLRPAIATLDRAAQRPAARYTFGLEPDAPTLLVFGGSQGARRLNTALTQALMELLDAGIQVLHAAGPANEALVKELSFRAKGRPYVGMQYIDDMAAAYAAADMAVTRAGAMTVAELTAVGLPSLYVPLPIGNGEQKINAAPVVAAGGGFLIDDAALDGRRLVSTVLPVLTDPVRRVNMGAAAASFGIRDASERLVEVVLKAAKYQPAATTEES
jgi:UDP-N-acetylglucosamine--N-acetylmuramyl-(pentapeptide) pyrophosphoryl-undecaprenol N-acetylglucosamine transferase